MRCGPSKSRKTPWASVVLDSPTRVRSRVKANAHAYTHELSRPFTAVYLRRAGTRSLRPRWSFPRHRLKRHSAKIIKGWPPIDPVNSVTTTLASLNAENASLFLPSPSCSLGPLLSRVLSLAIDGPRRARWLSKSYRPAVKLYVRAWTRDYFERRQ